MEDAAYIVGVVIGSVVMGGFVGLIPYFVAKKKDRKNMGVICLVLCILANFLGGLLLSVPVCLISVVLILVLAGRNAGNGGMTQSGNKNNTTNMNYSSGATQSQIYCSHCGSQVNTTSAYCAKCGHKVK